MHLIISNGLFKLGDIENWMYVRVARELELVGNLYDSFFNFIWSIIFASKFLVGLWKKWIVAGKGGV